VAEFRNAQNGGNWLVGQTYTFEVLLGDNSVISGDPPQVHENYDAFVTDVPVAENYQYYNPPTNTILYGDGAGYDQSGNIIFKGASAISGTQIVSSEDLEDGWKRITVAIPSNAPVGVATISTYVQNTLHPPIG
jgi:hypothetical protein